MFSLNPFFLRWLGGLICSVVLGLPGLAAGEGGDEVNATGNLWLTRTWQTDEGLPDNNVTGLAQAADGHLWVATLGGLMRFDGERFEEFSPTQLTNVPNRVVRNLYQDRQGQLWLVMDRGALVRVGDKDAHVYSPTNNFAYWRVATTAEDPSGDIWLVFGNEGGRIHGDNVERLAGPNQLPEAGISWLATDGQGQLWFASGTQVGIQRNHEWQTLVTMESGGLHLAAARGGGVWICTATRVVRFSEGGVPQEMARLPESMTVQTMLEDHAGALWIGTAANGLYRLQGANFEHVAVSHLEISALTEDREGNLWVGTAGGGLNLLRPRAIDLISPKSGLPFESV
ncbi:MAG TPA: two-component regulator propeller domain-containing protein, partial [Verrucomicrobiae bacterium]